jgi:ABC-type nitrate/sulfonate/bicarbonate transport system permease component
MGAAMARLEDAVPAAGAGTGARREAWLDATFWFLARWIIIALMLIAWETLARSGLVTAFMLPPLSTVLQRIWTDALSGELAVNAGVTLYRALVGFLIAASGGILLAVLMRSNRGVRWFFDPIISVGFPMPKIAFLPIIILWLGFYDVPKITMVVFDAIFPVVTATYAGLASVERELIWSARNMGAKEHELMWQIMLPAASPQIMTGLQVALPIAVIVAIVVEMKMGGYGLGGAMLNASRFADSRGVFAGIVEIAVIGFALVKGMAVLRRRLLLWHAEALEPSTV